MIKIPQIFKPLAYSLLNPSKSDIIYWVYYSGRGTGKSENIAAILVLTMYQNPNTRIACIREVQHSISESVKATLEKWISLFGLDESFHITGTSLRCRNGSECFFIGLKNSNSPNIKSIANISVTFIEEASQLSEKSWRLLVPSVTRVKYPKIVIAFNPDREDDIIYKEFVANTPPKASVVTHLKWEDNPFFRDSSLYNIMLDDKERLPNEVFAHIWEGALAKNVEDSLFKKAIWEPIRQKEVYTNIVIGVDPATTNSEHSNEYGIVIVAKTKDGECRVLEDYTGKYTPREFSSQIIKAYYEFNASTVIVETNQGGDFIKSSILDIDSKVRIVEVRAGTSKQSRALPLANMLEIGTLRFVTKLPKLQRQMELTTLRGYLGPRGESPDSLDACIWAVYYLMGIKERDSLYQVFKPEYFNQKLTSNCIKGQSQTFINCVNGVYYSIEVHAITSGSQVQLIIEDSKISLARKESDKPLIAPDTPANYSLNANKVYEKTTVKLEERIPSMLHIFKDNLIFIGDSHCEYQNLSGNMLKIALSQYTYDTKRETDPLIDLFLDIIELNFT